MEQNIQQNKTAENTNFTVCCRNGLKITVLNYNKEKETATLEGGLPFYPEIIDYYRTFDEQLNKMTYKNVPLFVLQYIIDKENGSINLFNFNMSIFWTGNKWSSQVDTEYANLYLLNELKTTTFENYKNKPSYGYLFSNHHSDYFENVFTFIVLLKQWTEAKQNTIQEFYK